MKEESWKIVANRKAKQVVTLVMRDNRYNAFAKAKELIRTNKYRSVYLYKEVKPTKANEDKWKRVTIFYRGDKLS